jgi:serine/threonine protein kinase/WD40 repeat protein
MSLPGAAASTVNFLASILNEIGAADRLQVFVDDDRDDDSIKTLANLTVEKIMNRYGLPQDKASAFSDKCRSVSSIPAPPNLFALMDSRSYESEDDITMSQTRIGDPSQSLSRPSLAATRNPMSTLTLPPISAFNDATIMQKLRMEMIRELGSGGFGTVYEVKNLADKLKVALKIVKNPQHAIHAVREGQRLRRVKHKNIVLMHKVHEISDGSCALEMEVVPGGDLSRHLEAHRRRPRARFPHDAVLRFSRQLLGALVYLHDELKWVHGDIKPQNILLQCSPIPADDSEVDYSSAEIKLADFGLIKILDQQSTTLSLSFLSSMVGAVKGTMMYLSPEAFSGSHERSVADDLWSACLVIYEMDTGLRLQGQGLMNGPGSVNIEALLTKSSPDLLPLLCSVLATQSAGSRCSSAAELLCKLDAGIDPLFIWQFCDPHTQHYVSVHPASSVFLEGAMSANEPLTGLPLPPPLDLVFDIQALLSSPTALGLQTEKRSGKKCRVRRVLKASVLNSSQGIPTWQELVDCKEWLQCGPAMCAKLDIDAKNPSQVIDTARYRYLPLDPGSIGAIQLPHPLKKEPYLAPAHADDIALINRRVHDSLPEWDVTSMEQVVNAALDSKYAAYRHRVAARCNGNPNEKMMFHFAPPAVITKIWQEGEGHDPRLSNWAEVGKGAYFSKHPMYGYAYKYSLWPSPPGFAVKAEPPIGECMQVFASLVCLGNVADMGPGCETCTSPAWEAWKKDFEYQKSTENPSPKPTRPPAIMLSADVAEKQHILDLTRVKDAPRYDSVKSTEGDLATHPASKNKDASGRRMCDIMHPRLRARAKEWAEQCVLFETAASYPMFIATLTKTRDSPMGPQQLMDAGCDPNRIKSLGFTANDVKALGKNVREMRAFGWSVLDLKNAGFSAQDMLAGGCAVSELHSVHFTATQMKDAGCPVPLLTTDFTLEELKAANFDIPSLRSSGYSLSDMKGAGFLASSLVAVGCGAKELKDAGFSALELKNAGFDLPALDRAGYTVQELKDANFTAVDISQTATFAIAEAAMERVRNRLAALTSLGASAAENQRLAEDTAGKGEFVKRILIRSATDDLVDALRRPDIDKNDATAQMLRSIGVKAQFLLAAGFLQTTLVAAGYSAQDVVVSQSSSSVPFVLWFVYKHWKMLLAAVLLALISIAIGLWLGGVMPMMALVVCLPHMVMLFVFWKFVTNDGTKFLGKWSIGFAVYFGVVFSLSMGIMLGIPSRDHEFVAAVAIFAVCVPMILCFALHYVVWCSRDVTKPYSAHNVVVFALVFTSILTLSLGLLMGFPQTLKVVSSTKITKIVWSPNGSKIAAAFADGTARVLSTEIGKDPNVVAPIIVSSVFVPMILCFAMHRLVWTSRDINKPYPISLCCIFVLVVSLLALSLGLLFRLSAPLTLLTLTGGDSLTWSLDGSKIATVTSNGTVRVWSSSSGSTLLALPGHSSSVMLVAVAWSPDGSKIAIASSDGTARVWSSSSGSTPVTVFAYGVDGDQYHSIEWSPDGTKIAASTRNLGVIVWSGSSGNTLLKIPVFGSVKVAWSPDGTQIATVPFGKSEKLFVWNSNSGSLLYELSAPNAGNGEFTSCSWSPDGTKIVTSRRHPFMENRGDNIHIHSSANGRFLWSIGYNFEPTVFGWSVAWSPDGTKIAAGYQNLILVFKYLHV